MKKLIILFFLFLTKYTNAQENALIIKHVGPSNAYISPIVISIDSLSQGFCNEHLIAYGKFIIKKNYVHSILVDTIEYKNILNEFSNLLVKNNDSTLFANKKGSFEFVFIENNIIKNKVSINNSHISMYILNEILGFSFSNNYLGLNDALEQTLRHFNPNPTKETVHPK